MTEQTFMEMQKTFIEKKKIKTIFMHKIISNLVQFLISLKIKLRDHIHDIVKNRKK